MSFWVELRRRNVFKVGVAYAIVAWLITQVVSAVNDPLGLPDWFATAIIVFLAVGFPVALLFAWAFELTPAGLKRTNDVVPEESTAVTTGRKLNYAVIGLVAGAIATTVVFQLWDSDGDAEAREEGIARVESAIDAGDWDEAYSIARRLEALIPETPEMAVLWSRFSQRNAITTDPPGARVYLSPYDAGEDEWEDLGVTPLDEIRIPYGLSRLRFELDGYRTLVRTTRQGGVSMLGATTEEQRVFQRPVFTLDTDETLPDNKVRIPGWEQSIAGTAVGFEDYFLGRHEVTNREYKEFVDAGGYERREFWQHPIVVDGREIAWEDSRELFVDETLRTGPSTWEAGDYLEGRDQYPVNGVSWYEAMAYARFVGEELPTVYHWDHAIERRADAWRVPRSNMESDGLAPVGEYRGLGQYGNFDMAGNVREWLANTAGDDRHIRGGSWIDPPYLASVATSAAPLDRSQFNGFRLAQTFDNAQVHAAARTDSPLTSDFPDLSDLQPISDEVFEAYRSMHSYDPTPLDASIEDTRDSRSWTREQITFEPAYDGQPLTLYLYLPKTSAPPYQTIVYFPNVWGGGARTIENIEFHLDFVVKSGRAVAFPMYLGGFARLDELRLAPGLWNTTAGRERLIQIHQDVRRTIDYLELRTDIDHDAFGYYGLSMGGFLAPQQLALESRIGAAVLTVAGIFPDTAEIHPAVDQLTYLPRIKIPVLMLNGEFDYVAPPASAIPFYELLGSEPENKKLITTPGGHFVPRTTLVRETLDWFDKYLGPPGI